MTKITAKHLSVRDQEDKRYITCKKYFLPLYGLWFPGRFCGINPSKRHIILRLAYGFFYRQNKINHKIQKKGLDWWN